MVLIKKCCKQYQDNETKYFKSLTGRSFVHLWSWSLLLVGEILKFTDVRNYDKQQQKSMISLHLRMSHILP